MAIYHFSVKIFSRSKGESAIGKAAYRSGEDLYDRTIDKTFNYAHRQGDVAYREIMAPAVVPDWVGNRQELWSQVEEKERRKDAQLAREFVVALPCELSFDTNKEMLRGFIKDNFVSKGMIADIAIHDIDSHNPHAHVMLTMREVTADGFGQKNRGWNAKDTLESWRKNWDTTVNNFLADNGSAERVDHRTLEAQKIDREPTIHLGVHATGMERKGIKTRLGDFNRNVIQRNRAVMMLKASMSKAIKSPVTLWNLVKNSAQVKNLHPYLRPVGFKPEMAGIFHEKMQKTTSHNNQPGIDI